MGSSSRGQKSCIQKYNTLAKQSQDRMSQAALHKNQQQEGIKDFLHKQPMNTLHDSLIIT